MIAVGLFAANDSLENTTMGRSGLFHGGGFYFLGVQALACVVISAWSAVVTSVLLVVGLNEIILAYNIVTDYPLLM